MIMKILTIINYELFQLDSRRRQLRSVSNPWYVIPFSYFIPGLSYYSISFNPLTGEINNDLPDHLKVTYYLPSNLFR